MIVAKKRQLLLFFILGLGLFLRIYRAPELFMYNHDNDLAGWFVRDVIENGHLRLVGQETSTQGIFIGPFYYYLLIPFYLLFNFDPIGGVLLVTILGLFTIWSLYFCLSKVFNSTTGLVSAFLYAVSFYTVFNDREVVPTMPVILWTVWYFYSLNLLLKGENKKGLILAGVLIGLIWHLNFALVLVIPLIPLALYLSKQKLKLNYIIEGSLTFILTSLPLILFEFRHNFSQFRWLLLALTTDQKDILSGFDKFLRIVYLAGKNISGLLWGNLVSIKQEYIFIIFVLIFIAAFYKKIITRNVGFLMGAWIVVYITFFSLYSKSVSEYYLNGLVLIWLILMATFITKILAKRNLQFIGVLILAVFIYVNVYRFFTININKSGYVERKAIVQEIKSDATKHGYPCIAISYITDPGYELGYRYFFWLEKMHVNKPESGSPVYTIVFPLKQIFKEDKTFGALGLIYPDYERYTIEEIEESCSGENSNLTDSMFGFVN